MSSVLNTEAKQTIRAKEKKRGPWNASSSKSKESCQWNFPLQMWVPLTLILCMLGSIKSLDLPAMENRIVHEEFINVLQSKLGSSRVTVYLNSTSNSGTVTSKQNSLFPLSPNSDLLSSLYFFFTYSPPAHLKVVATGLDLTTQPPTVVKGKPWI